ncbi:DgyrCDS10996 [Dimorphilus gyrociliatus]|uniref:DgyrCDS10996 n=1 Tax=Dimorphilus gyrociliatus TaxID=2664684 RepID=A0A7I8W327_9ANNE|nr:DgyrCDS10996 [Dimorphilus gyrociliatus]
MPVMVMQPSGHTTISGNRTGPNSHLCISIFAFIINPVIGLVALGFSCASRHIAPMDWEAARVRGKVAMVIAVTSITLSSIAILVVVLIFFTRDS